MEITQPNGGKKFSQNLFRTCDACVAGGGGELTGAPGINTICVDIHTIKSPAIKVSLGL